MNDPEGKPLKTWPTSERLLYAVEACLLLFHGSETINDLL